MPYREIVRRQFFGFFVGVELYDIVPAPFPVINAEVVIPERYLWLDLNSGLEFRLRA